ncbi:MAG: response regulator [Bacteroidota bacterium]
MNKQKIFIVEDDSLSNDHLKLILEKHGYAVVGSVLSGEEAIAQVPNCQPDLIIMDVNLEHGKGQLDGIQTTTAIQQSYDIPVIYLTAYKDTYMLNKVAHTDYHTYLTKPYEPIDILSAVDKAFRSQVVQPPILVPADDFMLLPNGAKHEKVALSDIVLIESDNQYLTVHTTSGRNYMKALSLAKFLRDNPLEDFIRINQRQIVNKSLVTAWESPGTIILGDRNFEVSKALRKEVKAKLPFL